MSESRLFAEYPEVQNFSYVSFFNILHPEYEPSVRKEDLEDLMTDSQYFQAIFHTLPKVKALVQAQSELGMANESIASQLISNLHKHETGSNINFRE